MGYFHGSMKNVEGVGTSKKLSRILAGIVLVVYGLYHVAAQYYAALDPRLLVPSWNGIAALYDYESGRYEKASRRWRFLYGLAYDPSTSVELRTMLSERIKKEPENTETYYQLADLFFSRENYDAAATTYRAILARDKRDYEANVGLATCLSLQGDFKLSRAVFNRLFRQNNQSRDLRSFLNILVALDRLERTTNNGNADRYLTLAQINRYLRIIDARREKAVLSYADKALERDGKLDEAYVCKGAMYVKKGDYRRALDQLGMCVRVNPENADAYDRMGFTYGMLGDPEKELACYRKAVELERDDPRYAYNLGDILEEKYADFRQASFYYKKALDLDPSNYTTLSSYGYSLMLLKEYKKALDVCAVMIGNYPDFSYGYKLKADCFMGMKRYGEAVKFYLKSHEVAMKSGEESNLDFKAFTDLGVAYTKLGKTEDAIAAYREALKIKPYDVDALYSLQYLYRREGKFEEAYAAVKEILRIQPDHAGARRLLPYMQRNIAGRGL